MDELVPVKCTNRVGSPHPRPNYNPYRITVWSLQFATRNKKRGLELGCGQVSFAFCPKRDAKRERVISIKP